MAFQLSMNMTYAGREPEVLSDLIMRRQKLFGETAQQAVIGTGISVMTSLRAQTRVADETKMEFSKLDVIVRWVTRAGKKTIEVDNKPLGKTIKRLFGRYYKGQKLMCYKAAVYSQGEKESYILVCEHESQVVAYLRKRVNRYKRMARSAWGHLMRMSSQREASADPISNKASDVLRKELSSVSSGNQYDFALTVSDGLAYAGKALKAGPQSVSLAMQAASNKIAGRIRKFCAEHPTFEGQNIQTPFPEIAQRK
jgi:hypothetical protein